MRLRRLDLTRYGKFTDQVIDFGARPEVNTPDLHILYGPNEAGKSTTLSAWLDLLFGIPNQTRYNFLHPNTTMRVGAMLELDTQSIEIARIKGNKGTLLNGQGAPIPEAVLAGPLGGLDRAGLRAMFSLDDETLEEGGESILKSEGDVGQLLFATSAGLADFSSRLDALRQAADAVHRPGGRKGSLTDLKVALDAVQAERKTLDTVAADYARLTAAHSAAKAVWEAAQKQRDADAANLRQIDLDMAALPLFDRLQDVEADLAALPILPPPPEGWEAELQRLENQQIEARAHCDGLAGPMAAAKSVLANTPPDPDMLAVASAVTDAEALKSAHDEAVKDLPARIAERDDLCRRIKALAASLGRSETAPHLIPPDAATAASLRRMIETRSGVESDLAAAKSEYENAQAILAKVTDDLAAAGGAKNGAILGNLLRQIRTEDPSGALQRSRAKSAEAAARQQDALAALAPWKGSIDDLAAQSPPTAAHIAAWKTGLQSGQSAEKTAQAECLRLQSAVARNAAVPAPLSLSMDEVAAARSTREALWAAHLALLSAASAAAFETAMRIDDQIAAHLADVLAASQRHADAIQENATLGQSLTEARAQHGAASAMIAALTADMADAAKALSLPLPSPSPDALAEWCRRRETALIAHAEYQAAKRAEETARNAFDAAESALAAAMPDATGPFALLMARAETLVDAAQEQAALSKRHKDAGAALATRYDAFVAAQSADVAWQKDWLAACKHTWLHDASVLDVVQMRAALEIADEMSRHLRDVQQLEHRIARMQENRTQFIAALNDIAARLGHAVAPAPELWGQLTRRLGAASDAEKQRQTASADLSSYQQVITGNVATLAVVAKRLAEMATHLGASNTEGLRAQLAAAKTRAQAEAEFFRLKSNLTQMLSGTWDALRDRLGSLDREALGRDQARLSAEKSLSSEATEIAYANLKEARRQLDAVGGDDAVARLDEQAQTLLLQIAELARDQAARRLGLIATEHALRRYRDSHRSSMIEAASAAFRTISRGAYSGLAAQPDGEREVLVALSVAGGAKLARDLSKGARFQLYLALRVAGFHELANHSAPPPFIADDIMETFDDDRSAEAFMLLSGMAVRGQVIYLTHHRHLCYIARNTCPSVQIHELG